MLNILLWTLSRPSSSLSLSLFFTLCFLLSLVFHVKLLTQALLSLFSFFVPFYSVGTVRSKREKKMHLMSTDISWLLLRLKRFLIVLGFSESSIYVFREVFGRFGRLWWSFTGISRDFSNDLKKEKKCGTWGDWSILFQEQKRIDRSGTKKWVVNHEAWIDQSETNTDKCRW